MQFTPFTPKLGMTLLVGVAAIAIIAYFVMKKGSNATEGFQTVQPQQDATAATAASIIPEEALKALEPCKVMKNLLINLDNQIKAAETGTTAPGQIELLKITRGSLTQQMLASNCT